nr:NnrU family protein [Sphingorhabdus sp. Alg239-R122]
MNPVIALLLACTAFVASHFIMSHPMRDGLVARFGTGGFLGLYSLVAAIFLGLMIWAYMSIPSSAPYWGAGRGIWDSATLVMLVASILYVGSNIRNPALPNPKAAERDIPPPHGVFRITRHPMMWSFALWALVHIMIAPRIDNFILMGSIIFLALVGAHMQDRKKERLLGDAWRQWKSATSFIPFGRGLAAPGWIAFVGGILLWLLATWLHAPLGAPEAGIWSYL